MIGRAWWMANERAPPTPLPRGGGRVSAHSMSHGHQREPVQGQTVIVSGVLYDAGGQIVSIGSSFGLEEDIAPGASVRFELRVAREPYTSYRLCAQAERDWD